MTTKTKRKTIGVSEIKQKVNRMLKVPGISQDAKQILSSLMEEVLMETGNYKGFGFNGNPEDKTREYDRNYF